MVFECPCSGVWEPGQDGTPGEFALSFGLRSHRAVDSNELRITGLPHQSDTQVAMAPLKAGEVAEERRIEITLAQAPTAGEPIRFVLWERLGNVGPDPTGIWIDHEQLSLWAVSNDDSAGRVDYVDILTDTDGDGVGDLNERIAGTAADDDTSTPGLSEVDVLALYNDGFSRHYGGYPHARIHHSITVTRALFADKGTGIRLRTVGMREVFLASSGLVPWGERARLMDLHGADVVLRFHAGPKDFCRGNSGCATLGGYQLRGYLRDPGLAIVHASAAVGTTPAHELGHAFGLAHSARQGESHGTFRWSRGHWDSRFGTIMSYGRADTQPEFSNPDADCVWAPCGVSSDAFDGADAVASLSLVRFQAAARRPAKTDADGDGIVDPGDAFPEDPDEWADNDDDGVGDNADEDDDNDGINDTEDPFPLDPAEWADVDGDGIGDNADEEILDAPIRDPALLAAVERALGKAEGDGVTEEELASLEELVADGQNIGSLVGLEHATDLARLFLSSNRIASLAPLAELSGLRTLNVLSNPLSDLSALSGFSGLQYLYVDALERSPDLSPLSKLERLRVLQIRGGQLPPLAGLAELRRLYLSGTQVEDLSLLDGLVGLWQLSISATPVRDLSALAELDRLQYLSIRRGEIRDVTPLGSLDLRSLHLEHNFIVDPTPLSTLKDLSELVLAGNPIEDVSAFAAMSALRHLDLTGTRVGDLTPISSSSLETLMVSRTEVTLGEDAALPHAPNLDRLDASGLGIRDVSALSDFRSLRRIDLADNRIWDVSPLGDLDDLDRLTIDRNEISDLGPLVRRDLWSDGARLEVSGNPLDEESLGEHIPTLQSWGVRVTARPKLRIADPALQALIAQTLARGQTLVDSEITGQSIRLLKRLTAYGRGIAELTGLEAAVGLRELYIGSNAVSDVSPLSGLPLLSWVDLSDNLISDISPLVENDDFAGGDWVTLSGNPLTEESVNSHIPVLLARGVQVRLDSVALTVASGRQTSYDLAGYFEALLGSDVVVTAESDRPDFVWAEMSGATLTVTTAWAEGTVTVTLSATGADGEIEALDIELTVEHAGSVPVTVTITADEDPVGEGNSADFTLTRSDSSGALTVDVAVSETGAVIAGTLPTTVTFDDGMASAALSVATEDDAVDEPDSSVTARVLPGEGYAAGVPHSATVTVADDDEPLIVTIVADASPVSEGTTADFTLTRSGSSGALTVNVSVSETGAMIAGTLPTTVTFDDGMAGVALSIATEDDDVYEPASVITATLAAGTGYARGTPASAMVTVTDDDQASSGVAFVAGRTITSAADEAVDVHAADLDGDGDADVLSASRADDKIAWYENLGDGTFSAQQVITTDADSAQSVHAADLDRDGDADVLSASQSDDKIAWHENLGDGTFSAQRVITTDASGAQSVHAADLDGDGDADVLSASLYDDKIAWHENLGGGTFSAQQVITTDADRAVSVHAADLDGDGDADVLSASQSDDKIAWYENLGGGTFSAQQVITTDADYAYSVHAADLDGDGDADVLSASFVDNKVAWHENLGGGTFSAQRVITTDADGAILVHAADLDGDSDVDVLFGSWRGGRVAWHENLGDGTFSPQRDITTEADVAHSVHAADLDGDGDADVLSASRNGDKIAWYENLSDHGDDHGDLAESATLVTALPAFQHGVLESASDNDMFRLATGRGTLKFHTNGPTDTQGWLLNEAGDLLAFDDRDGNFLIEDEVEAGVHYVDVFGPANETGPYTLSIEFVAGDPDADDHGDMPATATALSTLPWFGTAKLNADSDRDVFRIDVSEPGMLTVYTADAGAGADTYGVLTDANGAVLAEDDNSGDRANFEIEVAVDDGTHYVEVRGVAGQPTGSYYLFIELTVTGGSTVAMGPQQAISTDADGAVSVYAADLWDDGLADVLSASRLDDKIAWYENLGGNGFSVELLITTDADGARAVHAADLDGDGDADVLSGSYDDDKIAWYENRGGAFSAQRVIATRFPGFVSVHAADLDGDGDADVLGMSGDLDWYENLGNGGFADPRTIGAGGSGGRGSVHAADLDGDGDQDVLSAGHASSGPGIAWYENGGDGTFSRHDFGGLVDVVYAADLDGDGDPDVVVAHGSSNVAVVAWHENLGGGAFSAERPITTLASGGQSLHAADLDGDGDVDVLSASYSDGKIAWYGNRGDGSFLGQHVIAEVDGAESVHSVDLDGDGDPDVLSASQGDDTIAWYENLSDHGDDHGGTPEAATLAATLPALLLGKVESPGDKDVFRVSAGTGTLRLSTSGPTDTLGRLLDANGGQLARNDDSDGLNFGIETEVTAGIHYVEVGAFADNTGPYTLSIEFVAD